MRGINHCHACLKEIAEDATPVEEAAATSTSGTWFGMVFAAFCSGLLLWWLQGVLSP